MLGPATASLPSCVLGLCIAFEGCVVLFFMRQHLFNDVFDKTLVMLEDVAIAGSA